MTVSWQPVMTFAGSHKTPSSSKIPSHSFPAAPPIRAPPCTHQAPDPTSGGGTYSITLSFPDRDIYPPSFQLTNDLPFFFHFSDSILIDGPYKLLIPPCPSPRRFFPPHTIQSTPTKSFQVHDLRAIALPYLEKIPYLLTKNHPLTHLQFATLSSGPPPLQTIFLHVISF